jgi:hypothetical protein
VITLCCIHTAQPTPESSHLRGAAAAALHVSCMHSRIGGDQKYICFQASYVYIYTYIRLILLITGMYYDACLIARIYYDGTQHALCPCILWEPCVDPLVCACANQGREGLDARNEHHWLPQPQQRGFSQDGGPRGSRGGQA